MDTEVEKIVHNFEAIYQNSIHHEMIKDNKCLAMDEQELAIVQMCFEIMNRCYKENIDEYKTQDLYIVLKKDLIGNDMCNDGYVNQQLLRYKKFKYLKDYSLNNYEEKLLVYYALLLFYANDEETRDYNNINRNYFRIYAMYACISPNIFNIMCFNEIYIFMRKVRIVSADVREMYLNQTRDLWEGFTILKKNQEILGKLLNEGSKIISNNSGKASHYEAKIYNLIVDGFLAFDYIGGDMMVSSRYKSILCGMEYFKLYLELYQNEIDRHLGEGNRERKIIDEILDFLQQVKDIFVELLNKEGFEYKEIEIDEPNLDELIDSFVNYCKRKNIALIKE